MTTGDKRINLALKRYITNSDLETNFFNFLRNESLDSVKRFYRSFKKYDENFSGLFTDGIHISVNFGLNSFDIYPYIIEGITGSGYYIKTESRHVTNKAFENLNGYHYIVAVNHCEVPDGIINNPRTGLFEYDKWLSEVGSVTNPTSVTENTDGTITFNVNGLLQSGVDFTNTRVKVWLNNPETNNQIIAIEDLNVSYSNPNNTITTVSSLGQPIISTSVSDYKVAIIGLEVRNAGNLLIPSNVFDDEYIILGRIIGGDTSGNFGLVDDLYKLYFYKPNTDHHIQTIVENDITSIAKPTYSDPRIICVGDYSSAKNVHTVLVSDINTGLLVTKEYISYNGYEFYDNSSPPWDGTHNTLDMVGYDDSLGNYRRIAITNDKPYFSSNMGVWTIWSSASSSVWGGIGVNPLTGFLVLVDSTNKKIYTAAGPGLLLTERHDFSSLSVSSGIYDVVYSNDTDNPFWIVMDRNGFYITSVDGITWSNSEQLVNASGNIDIPGTPPYWSEWEGCRECLAYDKLRNRWVMIASNGVLSGNYYQTIYYSDDNGDNWTEVVDAFKFRYNTEIHSIYETDPVSNPTYTGHRSIVVDNNGNYIVTIIKKRNDINRANQGILLTFVSKDGGTNWFEVRSKQVDGSLSGSAGGVDAVTFGITSWFNPDTNEIQFVQIGKISGGNNYWYFNSSFNDKD